MTLQCQSNRLITMGTLWQEKSGQSNCHFLTFKLKICTHFCRETYHRLCGWPHSSSSALRWSSLRCNYYIAVIVCFENGNKFELNWIFNQLLSERVLSIFNSIFVHFVSLYLKTKSNHDLPFCQHMHLLLLYSLKSYDKLLVQDKEMRCEMRFGDKHHFDWSINIISNLNLYDMTNILHILACWLLLFFGRFWHTIPST